jgi:colanic acid/amylovoran biosynthesis protein
MQIVIANATLANGGDAAIVYSMIALLRRTFGADTQINVIDSLADTSRRHYPDLDVSQTIGMHPPATQSGWPRLRARVARRLKKSRIRLAMSLRKSGIALSRFLLTGEEYAVFRRYADADMVISVGGTYLVDHYDFSPRLLEFDIAIAHGKPPLFFTQSVGPFMRAGLREKIVGYFTESPLILLRDEKSRQCLASLGIAPDKMHVLADGVFAFADPDILRGAGASHGPVRQVAISVRNWSHFSDGATADSMARYINGIARAAEYLIRQHGCEVTFLSTCQGIAEYQAKDSNVAELVVAAMSSDLDHSKLRVDSGFHTPLELMAIVARFDLVIATRMHMAILALCAGVPVLPIAYEFKTQELFQRLGMTEWVTTIENVQAETFPAHLERFLLALPALRARLFAAVEREHERALTAGPLLQSAAEKTAT